MNQTSVPSFVVPVFPAAGMWKPEAHTLAALPRRTTSFIMSTISHASSRVIVSKRAGFDSQMVSPLAFSTLSTAVGTARTPSVAKALYAATISIG
jgi:hypothetical protein